MSRKLALKILEAKVSSQTVKSTFDDLEAIIAEFKDTEDEDEYEELKASLASGIDDYLGHLSSLVTDKDLPNHKKMADMIKKFNNELKTWIATRM